MERKEVHYSSSPRSAHSSLPEDTQTQVALSSVCLDFVRSSGARFACVRLAVLSRAEVVGW